ncbi:MAG: Bacterial transcription activator, effector binding domain [Bacteroidota bacterium]|nr:Bacterial transcription activator, effector binding domain [Bacteroidota bacterium]
MNIQIIDTPLNIDIYGFSGTAVNKDYAATAFKLSGKMWQTLKENGIKNKGQNIWVYEPGENVFAGVELVDPTNDSALQHKSITLKNYAYYKHIGPYGLIKQAGQNMIEEIKRKGLQTTLPYIEIYGHWNSDESKLETELLMSLI